MKVSLDDGQQGYALLTILLMLLSSGIVFGLGSFKYLSIHRQDVDELMQYDELLQSRQALLSYASFYPSLYGPRGAGVGHFPCPDTDVINSFYDLHWSSLAGPNPPCGSNLVAKGNLPSHINIGSTRYMIHAKTRSPIEYHVSSRVVNNPVNRIVNPSLKQDEIHDLGAFIVLREPTVDGVFNRYAPRQTVVSRTSLLLATRTSTAAWFISRLNELDRGSCLLSLFSALNIWPEAIYYDQSLEEVVLNPFCDQLSSYIDTCYSVNENLEVPTGSENLMVPFDSLFNEASASEAQLVVIKLLLLDQLPKLSTCSDLESLFDVSSIEFVPVSRHWFVRNDWPKWFSIGVQGSCFSASANSCRLRFGEHYSQEGLNEKLTISWKETI